MMLIIKMFPWCWVWFSCCYGNCSLACKVFGSREERKDREGEKIMNVWINKRMSELKQTFLAVSHRLEDTVSGGICLGGFSAGTFWQPAWWNDGVLVLGKQHTGNQRVYLMFFLKWENECFCTSHGYINSLCRGSAQTLVMNVEFILPLESHHINFSSKCKCFFVLKLEYWFFFFNNLFMKNINNMPTLTLTLTICPTVESKNRWNTREN